MSRNKKYTIKLINKGQISSNLHYGPYSHDWWIPNLKITEDNIRTLPLRLYMNIITRINNYDFTLSIVNRPSNPLQPGFLCSVEEKISNIEDTPSAAINFIYRELFKNQTEYSGLALYGFYDNEIVSELLADISFFPLYLRINRFSVVVSSIGYSSREDLLFAGPGYASSLVIYRNSETYHILQQILEDHCSLRVFKGQNQICQYVGKTPTIVWKKYGMCKNNDYLALFGLKDSKVQALLANERKKSMICTSCTSLQWKDGSTLQQIFNLHIKRRKLTVPTEEWEALFTKWITQQSSITQFLHILYSIYPPDYAFQHKDLVAWRAMFQACGCTNITPYSKEESEVEFWTCAADPRSDRQTLYNLHQWELL